MKLQFTIDYRILKACEAVASRDDTRYTLCGVLVEIPSDSHVILVASDARSLFSIRVRVDVSGFTKPRQYIIPIGLVEMLSGFRQGGSGMVTVEIEHGVTVSTTPTITITDHNARDVTTYSRNAIVGIYPDWRAACAINKPLVRASEDFNATYLATISRAAEILTGNNSGVSLWNTGQRRAMVVKADWQQNEVFAVVMPVVCFSSGHIPPDVPEWTKRLPKKPVPAEPDRDDTHDAEYREEAARDRKRFRDAHEGGFTTWRRENDPIEIPRALLLAQTRDCSRILPRVRKPDKPQTKRAQMVPGMRKGKPMIDPTTRRLLWLLFWSVIFFVFVVMNYVQTRERIEERNHAATNASMVPPSTKQVRTP